MIGLLEETRNVLSTIVAVAKMKGKSGIKSSSVDAATAATTPAGTATTFLREIESEIVRPTAAAEASGGNRLPRPQVRPS